jgi:hypothetical protein
MNRIRKFAAGAWVLIMCANTTRFIGHYWNKPNMHPPN